MKNIGNHVQFDLNHQYNNCLDDIASTQSKSPGRKSPLDYLQLECPDCTYYSNNECVFCRGLSSIKQDSAFSKFVESILDFKFQNKPKKNSKNAKWQEEVQLLDSFYDSLINNTKQRNHSTKFERKSTYCIQSTRHIEKQSMIKHNGIGCNQCNQYPICGTRYKCKICEDYDSCQPCYLKNIHQHRSWHQIQKPRSTANKQQLKSIMLQKQSKGLNCGRLSQTVNYNPPHKSSIH